MSPSTCYYYHANRPVRAEGSPTVVMLHGAGQDHSVWSQQSRWLAYHGYPVLVPDLPGHGRSSTQRTTSIDAQCPACRTVAEFAAAIAQLIDELELTQIALVGHSMGSLIALELAGLLSSRAQPIVQGLALLGTAAPMKVSDYLLEGSLRGDLDVHRAITTWSHAPRTPYRASPLPGMSLYGVSMALLARCPPEVLHADFKACHEYRDALTRAAALDVPSLVLAGAADVMTPPKLGRAVAEAFKHGEFQVLAGVGHSMMVEAPVAVQQALGAWLTRCRASV